MGDLINKVDAKFIVKQIAKQIAKENGTVDCITYALKLVYDEMDEIPIMDAEPVRHERWAHLGGDEWCCTGCGEVIHTEGSWERPTKKVLP